MASIFILQDDIGGSILSPAVDSQLDAEQLRSNFLKVGSYRKISIHEIEIASGAIDALSSVKISGQLRQNSCANLKVEINNPVGVVTDTVRFDVTSGSAYTTFEGIMNLETDEIDDTTGIGDFRERAKSKVLELYKERLENDNP